MLRITIAVLLLCTAALLTVSACGDAYDIGRVGSQLHLYLKGTPEQSYLRHVKLFVEQGMADYVFLVGQGLSGADRDRAVAYLSEKQVPFLVQEDYEAGKRFYDAGDYARLKRFGGQCFLGVHWGELDSSGLKPEDYLPKDVGAIPTRRQVSAAFNARVRQIVDDFHNNAQVPFAHSSATLSHGTFGAAGVDVICSEIGENTPNVGLMIASNRGAARAYGKPWMIDYSTWWAPRGNAGEQVSPREGHTPWAMFSSLLDAVMGGADYAQLEVDWAAYDTKKIPDLAEGETPPLLPWGVALKTLNSVAHTIGPRGETVTPFAILLGRDAGWPGVGWRVGDVRATGLFDGIRHQFMQTRDADLSLKILDVFYPGFERCGWDPEYPGFLAESPLGTLDMLQDDLDATKYYRYKVLVALGYHQAEKDMLARLRAYVEQGGILVCGDSLFLDEHERLNAKDIDDALVGCKVKTKEKDLIELKEVEGTLDAEDGLLNKADQHEWQRHWVHPVQLTTGRAVARLGQTPYIIENEVGKGRVYFVAGLNMVDSSATRRGAEPFLYANTLSAFLRSLSEHVGDGMKFSPWNSLEHVLDRKPDGSAMLLVMNHGDMDSVRDATMKNPAGYTHGRAAAAGTWEKAGAGDELHFAQMGPDLRWSFTMPPKSFVVFEFR